MLQLPVAFGAPGQITAVKRLKHAELDFGGETPDGGGGVGTTRASAKAWVPSLLAYPAATGRPLSSETTDAAEANSPLPTGTSTALVELKVVSSGTVASER